MEIYSSLIIGLISFVIGYIVGYLTKDLVNDTIFKETSEQKQIREERERNTPPRVINSDNIRAIGFVIALILFGIALIADILTAYEMNPAFYVLIGTVAGLFYKAGSSIMKSDDSEKKDTKL